MVIRVVHKQSRCNCDSVCDWVDSPCVLVCVCVLLILASLHPGIPTSYTSTLPKTLFAKMTEGGGGAAGARCDLAAAIVCRICCLCLPLGFQCGQVVFSGFERRQGEGCQYARGARGCELQSIGVPSLLGPNCNLSARLLCRRESKDLKGHFSGSLIIGLITRMGNV